MSYEVPRILIVDDNRSLVMLLEGILRKEGYQVLSAFDGIEGLETAIKQKPNLIVLDIEMPGIDGYEMCRRLQRYKTTRKIPIIMLTVKGQLATVPSGDKRTYETRLAERNKGFEVGAVEFMSKPIQARILIERVKGLLWLHSD